MGVPKIEDACRSETGGTPSQTGRGTLASTARVSPCSESVTADCLISAVHVSGKYEGMGYISGVFGGQKQCGQSLGGVIGYRSVLAGSLEAFQLQFATHYYDELRYATYLSSYR